MGQQRGDFRGLGLDRLGRRVGGRAGRREIGGLQPEPQQEQPSGGSGHTERGGAEARADSGRTPLRLPRRRSRGRGERLERILLL
ncbi:MAG: hypothetical protein ABFS46_17185, partial [Myxococcota bacterium]